MLMFKNLDGVTPGTPRVQFANIRKMVLCQGLPRCFTSMCQPMHGTSCSKSQLKSRCLTAKFGSFLDHAETGKKGGKCAQFFCPTSDFFDFCNPCFFNPTCTFTNDVDFVDKAYARLDHISNHTGRHLLPKN